MRFHPSHSPNSLFRSHPREPFQWIQPKLNSRHEHNQEGTNSHHWRQTKSFSRKNNCSKIESRSLKNKNKKSSKESKMISNCLSNCKLSKETTHFLCPPVKPHETYWPNRTLSDPDKTRISETLREWTITHLRQWTMKVRRSSRLKNCTWKKYKMPNGWNYKRTKMKVSFGLIFSKNRQTADFRT